MLAGLLIVGTVGFNFVLHKYQRDRLISFLNPNLDPSGLNYNQRQSMVAVGSGQF
jgi:rod shape determining protein RodA